MNKVLERLHRDHVHMAELMKILGGEINALASGLRSPDYVLMKEIMEYMHDYGDCMHHPLEDQIFAKLLESDGGMEHDQVVQVLVNEHESLSRLGSNFLATVDGILNELVVPRSQVEEEGRAYLAMMRQHMDMEESQAYPAAEKHIDSEVWQELYQSAVSLTDKDFSELVAQEYQRLNEHLKSLTSS